MSRYEDLKKKRNGNTKVEKEPEQSTKSRYQKLKENRGVRNYGVDDNYINTFLQDAKNFLDTSVEERKNLTWQSATDTNKNRSREETWSDLNSRSSVIRAYLNANKSNLDEDTYNELTSYLDSLKSANNEVFHSFRNAEKFYSSFKDEEDYNFWDSRNTVEKRQELYDEQQAKIDELSGVLDNYDTIDLWYQDYQERPWDFTAEEIAEKLPLYEKLKAYKQKYGSSKDIKDEIAAIETEMRNYERGNYNENGRFYGTKVVDDNYSVTLNPDFAITSANRNYDNPTRDELTEYDALTDSSTWYYDANDILRDAYGNEIVEDSTGHLVNPKAQGQEYAIKDRLGLFLSATDRDIEEYMGTIVSGTWGNIIGDGLDGSWKYLKDTEVGIYYTYLGESEEKAYQYLADMKTELNRRQTLDEIGQWHEGYEDANFLEKIALNAATLPAKFASNLIGGVEDAVNMLKGDDINPYSYAHSGMHFSQTIRGDTAEELDKTGFKIPVIDFTLGDIYQTGMSRLDSALATSVFGGGGTVFLGLGAAQEEAYRLYQQGASAEQVTLGAFAAGAAEAVFEYASFDKLVKMEDADTIWKWVKSALIQGGIEASEETLTEVSNIITNAVIMGQQSDLAELYEKNGRDWFKTGLSLVQQTAHAAFGGFLGGLGAGGVQGGKSYFNTQAQYASAGEKINDSVGGVDSLKKLANEVAGVSDAKMQKSLNKQIAAVEKNASNRKVGKLYNTLGNAYNAQNKADIVTILEMNKFGSEQANAIADAVVALASGNLTEQQAGILEMYKDNEHVKGVINSYDYDERSSIGKRNKALSDFESGVAISMMAKQFAENAFTPSGDYAVSKDGKAKALVTEEFEGKTITKDTGEVIDIKRVKEIRKTEVNGKKKIELILDIGDGKEINAKNVSYANKKDALIYEAIANLGDNIDADTANKLISKFDGGNAMVFARGITQAYTYGFYGLDRSEMKGRKTLSAELTEAQRNFAYELGEKYRPVKDKADKKEAKVTKAPGEKGVYYRDKDGKATDIRTYLNETKIGLKDVQKTAIDVMEKMSAMMGVRFNVFESWVENGNRYYLNEDGEVVKGNPNGFYDTATGEIYIDLNAGNDYQGTMLFTVAHELTHFMRQWSPEQFTKIANIVFKHSGMKGNVAKLAAIKQAKAEAKGKPISYDTAMEEVVADGMETILKDGKVLEFMEDVKKTDHEAWSKIKEWFQKLADFLKELVDVYKPHSAQTVEGAKVAEFAEDLLNQIKQLYAEGAVSAGENYQMAIGKVKVSNQITMEEDVIDSSNTGISKEAKTGVKMQERTEFEAQPKQVFRVSTVNGKAESNMLGTNKSVKELRDANFKENGFSKEEIDKINGFIKEMADNMTKYRLKYKFIGLQNIHDAKIILDPMSGKIVLSAMVNNSDYSVNFDFTKICKKRVALQEVLETLAREKGKVTDGNVSEVNLSPANIKHINDILASYGVETACLCCFVESKRYNIQNYYQEKVVDVWNALVDEVAPDAGYFNFADSDVDTSKIPDSEFADLEMQMKEWAGKTGKAKDVEQKMREFLADAPAARKKLRFSDLVTANGRTNLHKLYPEIESLILSKLGQSAPKSVEAFTPYNGEIDLLEATNNGDIIKYLYSIAGVRSQSFSDFMIAHVFDVLQKTASMSARKMPAHVYTKEIARAMLFGMTGEKHNLSVLHNVDPNVDSWSAGLSKDGEYNFSDYEAYKKGYSEFVQSIGWKDAVTLQNTEGYSKDCGIIGVGFSYNHMLKLHNDPEVRQVIGYHTSQMPVEVKPLTHLDKAADYTKVQNTMTFVGFAKPNYAIPEGVPSYATPPQDVTYKGNKTSKVSDTFDLVGTFNKLSKGKKGDARTAAAKETLRQLLEYANDHGYVIKTASGEKGKGEFALYDDIQKTQNPYLTTDHYIEYCIERGFLPMFYEFSMNPNYYKDIFDFNVFDRKSYNPETGLHEDSESRKAYAPQTAVHMLNEDGSLAFPENFFDIVDKQMSNYNSYMQDVDSKMPSIMDEVRAVTNSTSKLSDRDFTYKELTAKNPLNGRIIDKNRTVKLTSDGSIDREWVVAEVLKQCESLQTKAPLPTYYVNIPDIGKNVEITSKPIEHGFIKYEAKNGNPVPPRSMINARASLDLPHILQNSIEVNRSDRGDNAQVEFSHVLIGVTAMESANGTIEYYAVRSVVEARKNQGAILTEANVIGKLHAMNAKKIGKPHAQAGGNSTALTSSSLFAYSVADLLNDVKHKFDDTFSNDVYKHFGMTRRNSKFSQFLLFSDRDSDGNQLSAEQKKFFKDSVVRDADGNLMVMYHGTANGGAFTVFDGDKLGNRTLTSQIGQGFYFTNVKKEAESYMKNVDIYGRVSNGTNPNLHQVYLNITNPFDVNADTLDIDKVKSVYMDGTSDHFFDSYISHYLNNKTVNGRVFTKAEIQGMSKADRVSLYVDYLAQIGTKEMLSNMVQAFKFNAQSQLLASMKNRLGYDGIVEEFKPGQYQYVAFSSEQIKNVDNQNPTINPDIRYSDRDSLTPEQQKHFDYNQKQKAVGSALKTLKGSSIKRSTKYGVGKEIGGEIYFHKDYAEDILPDEVLSQALQLLEEEHPGFEYNCLKYNPKTGVVAFQEAPDFDSAREPVVGDYVSVNTDTGVVKTGHSNYIWHHKWNWVKNDYSGFDVAESWNWSKQWLSTLTEVSDGNGIERWNTQLDKFGLPHEGVMFSDREQEYDSKDTSVKILPATFTKFGLKATDRVLDWGGGQYDIAKKAVELGYPGIKFEVVDAFNRTKTHNDRILEEYAENPATVLTINNVLNVIKETDIIEDVIRESKEYLSEDGVCYIKIYEGNDVDGKTGNGKVTSSGWQNNQPAEWYRQFAEKYYQYVERSGDILIASDKPIDRKSLPKASKEATEAMRGKVKEIAKSEPSMRASLYSDRDDAPTFYSQMARVVDGLKDGKYGASSVISTLRGRGVKSEEIRWSGIEEWLADKKSVTRAELQEFIAGSMLQIEEEVLTNEERPYSEEHQKQLDEYTAERDKIGDTLAAEWKRITGEEFPIRNLGAGVGADVDRKIIDINLEHKKAAFEGRLLDKLRKDLKEVIANNDDFGFDSWKEALISIHRNRKNFVTHYEMSTDDKAVIIKYCNALNAYNEMPNKISDKDTDTLRDIAENIEKYNRKIIQVKSNHNSDNAKYMAKWGQYKLKGGENYREMLFKIPGSFYSNAAMNVHWGERDGVLAHARIQDLNTFLGKMLFIEEIQSDWHNEGHKSGYASDEAATLEKIKDLKQQWHSLYIKMLEASPTEARAISEKMDAIDTERASLAKKVRFGDSVPDAPFKDTYHEYVLKRLLREAAEQDYDSIGWTPADTQMERWNPSRKTNEQMGIEAKNPNAVAFEDGYRIEYDQDIPKFLNKYGKKWGTTVGKTVLDNGTEVWSMAITDSMKESVLTEGQALYQDRDTDSVSNRSLLANAFEGLAKDDTERNKIREYKEHIALINAEEKKLAELNAQIKELSFSKGPRDTKKIKSLRFDAAQTANRINTYDKQLLRLEASKPLQDVLNREKRRAYKKAEERGKEALAEYKTRVEAKQKETTEKWRESRKNAVAKARETADKRDAREKLQKLVLDTVKWITYPAKTDVKCPDILKQPYADFLNGIDLSSKRAANGGDPTKNDLRLANAMGSLATALDRIMTAQDPSQDSDKVLDTGYLDLPADFVQKLRDMTESIKGMMVEGDYVVNNMTAAEVRQLSQMIRTLNHAIKTMSKLYANLRFSNIEELGFDTMEFMDALGEIEKTGGMKDFVQWDNALPYYAFKRFGKGGESVFEGLMDAQDKLAFLAKVIFDFQEKTWTGKEAKAWSEDTHTITLPNGTELTLTTADAMSIYCLSRRDQGLQHLLGGGTRVMGIQKGSQKAKDSRSLLTIEDISAIISSLSDRQKQVAEAMQEFMSTVCSEWGNEISMKRFLTKEFTEKFYFPIESNDENLPTKDPAAQQSDLFRLLNISATKPLTPGANNEVIIRNIFDVFTGHASDMARLNAYGMALLDYMKWLNYREKTTNEEGQLNVRGVRKSMEKAYGNAAKSYVLNLVKDVNGRPSDGGDPAFWMKWMRAAKTASVGSSLRVATLQLTSYPRAALVLSPKSLALGLSKMPNINRAKKYCGIALWKSFGFYDTNISRSIEDQMKGVTDIKQKLIELSLKGAEWGDAITWGALWNACEYEVAQTTKNKIGSEEFYQEVANKLREVVYRTQVVDSMLTRSQIMRSKRGMAQEAAAFMSEPTLSANILMDAGFEFNAEKRRTGSAKTAWNKTGKYIGRAVAVYAIGQLTAALLEGLWDAWRDEDDEEFGEKYLDAFIENLVLDLAPFNKIPIVSDVFEAVLAMFDVGFYSSDKMSTTWLTQAVSAVDTWKDALSGESSVTVYNALYKTTRAISSFFGVSVSGVMREAVALWNNTAGAYDATLKILTWDRSKGELGDLLLDAIIEGNDRQAESFKAEFAAEGEYRSAIRTAIKSRYEAGELDENTAKQYLVKYGGLEGDDAYWKVQEWEYETETGEDFKKYNDFYTAVQTGKNLKAVIKEYTDNGVEAKTLASQITSYFKPKYKEMSNVERAAIKGYLLNAYELLGYNRVEKSKDIDKWLKD